MVIVPIKTWSCILFITWLQQFTLNAQSFVLEEEFNTCSSSLPLGWISYNDTGSAMWSCDPYALHGNGARMNGYVAGGYQQNNDWLISPKLHLNGYIHPSLQFWSKTNYPGNAIEVMISKDYTGTGDPGIATWTPLFFKLPLGESNIWFRSVVSLNLFKPLPFHIAIRYTSNNLSAAEWILDDILVKDSLSTEFINLNDCVSGYNSEIQSFYFKKAKIPGSFYVRVLPPFELSKDSISFSSNLSYSSSDENLTQKVYVRFSPLTANKVLRGEIRFEQNGQIEGSAIKLLATSIADKKSIKVATWNMRWFGDSTNCNCDTNFAKKQALTVLKAMNADVYCLQEVVAKNTIAELALALGSNYASVVSSFCSFASDTLDSSYPGGQKLAFIYNTNKINHLGSYGLLTSTYPANNNPYYCFASGRFPLVMKAEVNVNGTTDTLIIANIHGKAGSSQSDYDRRECATQFMTDSLQSSYPNGKVLVIGDYNDYLEGSTVNGQSNSSYAYLLNHGFNGISLQSIYPGATSFVGVPSHLIDNISQSGNLNAYGVDSAVVVFDEVLHFISNYITTTSDHLPIMGYWKFNYPTITEETSDLSKEIKLLNPSNGLLLLSSKLAVKETITVEIFDAIGRKIETCFWNEGTRFSQLIPSLQAGNYFVVIKQKNQHTYKKWLVIP